MGRAKLELKFIEQSRARMNTYKSRIKGMEKKAEELSVLCGVDVMFLSFSPDLNTIQCWPKEDSVFQRIMNRYKSLSSPKPPYKVPSPPLNSSYQQEELAALNRKLEEVSQMMKFLEEKKSDFSSQNGPEDSIEASSCAAMLNDDDEIFSALEMLGEDLVVSDLPSDSSAHAWNEEIFDWPIICSESFFEADVMSSELRDAAL